MIKASFTGADGTVIVVLGLSHANLDRLRADGLSGFIRINGNEIGVAGIEILITAGATEDAIAAHFKEFIGPQTDVQDFRRRPKS